MPLDLQLLRKDFTDQQIVDNFGNQLGIDVQKMRADKISDTVIAENLAAQYDSLIASKSAPKPDQGGAGPAIKPVSLEDTFTTQQVLNPAADAPDAANRQILKEKGFAAASADARAGMKARKAEDKAAFDKANAAAKKGEGYTERGREDVLSDAAIAGKQGLLNVMGGASWLVDKLPGIDTDGFTSAMLEGAQAEEANKSAETQAANRRVQKAEGVAETLDALLDDPMSIADMVFQSAPIMLPGMAAGSVAARVAARGAANKAIAAGATKEAARAAAAKAAMTAAAVGGVAGEGAISGGMSGAQTEAEIMGMPFDDLEQVSARYRELNLSMSPEEARDQLAAEVSLVTAVATGGATAGLGIAANKVLKLAGLGDPYSGALLKRLSATQAGKNVLAEVGQEIPQSMGEQVAGNLTNVDDSKEWSEDVGKAGVMGAVGAIGQSGAMQAGGAALRAAGFVPTVDDAAAPPAPSAPAAPPAAPVAPVAPANPAATGISPAGVPSVEALQAQADSAAAKSQELAALADEARGMGNAELASQYEAESVAAAADAKQALDTITVEHTGLQGVVNRTGVAALPLSADELAKGQIDAGNRAALGLDQLRDSEELQPVAPADDGTLAANVQTPDTTPTVNVAPEADPVGPAAGLTMNADQASSVSTETVPAPASAVASPFYIKHPETGEDVPVESIEDADRKFKALIASTGADFEGGMDVFDATTNQPVANLKASGKPTRVETADEKRARSAEDIAKMTALERVEPAAENEQALRKRMAYLRGAITASSDDKFKASAKDELKQITSKINALKGKAAGRAERVNALGDDNADTSPMVPRDKRDDPETPPETERQKDLRIATMNAEARMPADERAAKDAKGRALAAARNAGMTGEEIADIEEIASQRSESMAEFWAIGAQLLNDAVAKRNAGDGKPSTQKPKATADVHYPNRKLGFEKARSPEPHDPIGWGNVALANLQPGDKVKVNGNNLVVKSIGAKAVTFTKEDGKTTRYDVDTPRMAALVRDVGDLISGSPHSSHGKDWADILARDPAFRRAENGVIELVDPESLAESADVDGSNSKAPKKPKAVDGDEGDKRSQFPETARFAEWAIGKARETSEVVELDGKKYRKTIRIFKGDLGARAAKIRDEIGLSGEVFLVNKDDHTLSVSAGGKNRSDFGNVSVVETTFVAAQDRSALPSEAEMDLASRKKKLAMTLDYMSDGEIESLYNRMGLAGKNLTPEEKLSALKQESPDDIEAALKPKASANTIFTEDAAARAREIIRKRLSGSQLNAGLDPELLQAGITLAGYHVEKGARTFAAYSAAMIKDMGEEVRPYLRAWYMALKYDPDAADIAGDMSSEDEVSGSSDGVPYPEATDMGYVPFTEAYRQETVNDLVAEGVPRSVAERLSHKKRYVAPIDAVTGLIEGRRENQDGSTDAEHAVSRAISYVKRTNGNAFYISADVANLGGLNAFFNNVATDANKHYRGMADIVKNELAKIGATIDGFRTGGDEFGAIVIGADDETIRGALDAIRLSASAYTKANGLADFIHPKYPDDESRRGLGLHLGFAKLEPAISSKEAMRAADLDLDASKKGETTDVRGKQNAAGDRPVRDERPEGGRTEGQGTAGASREGGDGAGGSSARQSQDEVDLEQEVANRKEDARQARSERMRRLNAERAVLRPTDELLTAIAKLGGYDRSSAEADGIDKASFGERRAGIKLVFRNGGKSLDQLAEALDAEGYPVRDDQGRYSANVLLDLISRSLSGRPVYTPAGHEAAMMAEDIQRALEEGDDDALPPSEHADLTQAESVNAVSFIEVIRAGHDAETVARMIGDDASDAEIHALFTGLINGDTDYVQQYQDALRARSEDATDLAGRPEDSGAAQEDLPGFDEGQAADDLTDDELTRHFNGESLESIRASRQAAQTSIDDLTDADELTQSLRLWPAIQAIKDKGINADGVSIERDGRFARVRYNGQVVTVIAGRISKAEVLKGLRQNAKDAVIRIVESAARHFEKSLNLPEGSRLDYDARSDANFVEQVDSTNASIHIRSSNPGFVGFSGEIRLQFRKGEPAATLWLFNEENGVNILSERASSGRSHVYADSLPSLFDEVAAELNKHLPPRASDDFSLDTQTEEDLAAQEAALRAEEDRQAEEDAAAARKAEADRDRDQFILTGSNRQADANPNQNDMFGASSRPSAVEEAPKGNKPATTQIADAGDSLHWNRKNPWRSGGLTWSDVADKNVTLRMAMAVKSKIWAKPDWEEYLSDVPDDLRDAVTLAARMVKQVYDAIAAKPRTEAGIKDYIESVTKARDAAEAFLKDTDAVREFALAMADKAQARLARRVSILDVVGTVNVADKKKSQPIFAAMFPESIGQRRFAESEEGMARAIGRKAVSAMQFDIPEVVKAMKDISDNGWPSKREAWQVRGYSVVERNGVFVLRHKPSSSRFTRDISEHGSEAEAIEAARALVARPQSETEPRPEAIALDRLTRTGPPRRQSGEDVTPQDLIDTFGFRGINFGNYVPNDERQAHINHAFDAMLDMAEVLDLPPAAMSLGGMLGLAFGAQGNGGKNGAHFVPGVNEINLTRKSGAGALAHEWAHAVDHYFGVLGGLATAKEPFASWLHMFRRTGESTIRPEVKAAFKNIVDAMQKSKETIGDARNRIESYRSASKQNLDEHIARYSLEDKVAGNAEASAALEQIRNGEPGEYVEKPRRPRQRKAEATNANVLAVAQAAGLDNVDLELLAQAARSYSYAMKETIDEANLRTVHSEYYRSSRTADKDDNRSYWATEHEMFARAFEAYVLDKLASKEARNDYLVGGSTAEEEVAKRELKVYPVGADRKAINDGFDALFGTVQHKQEDGKTLLYSRSGSTRTAYEARIDALFAGEKPSLQGVRVLDKSDVLDLLGHGSHDVVLAEKHAVGDGQVNHPQFTAEDWKRVPEWMENPVAVFERDDGNLTILAPETKNGQPIVIGLRPNAASPSSGRAEVRYHLILTAYNKDSGSLPIGRMLREGQLRYIDQRKTPEFNANSGLQLPSNAHQLRGLDGKIYTGADLFKYRQISGSLYSRGGTPSSNTKASVESIIAPIIAKWKSGPRVVVVQSVTELPGSSVPHDVEGAYAGNGVVYLVADNLPTEERILEVLSHEAVGHAAMESMLGADLMAELTKEIGAWERRGSAFFVKLGKDVDASQPGLPADRRAKEIVALMAERGLHKTGSLWQRVTGAIRAWLRSMGFNGRWLNRLTEGDMFKMLADAERYLTDGPSGPGTGRKNAEAALAYSRSYDTKSSYEKRIDELMSGADGNRKGVMVLDRADILDLLGHSNKPLHLVESAVGKTSAGGEIKHPGMTAAQWKLVPEWIENPVAAFKSDTEEGRITLIAPDLVGGKPVLIVLQPNGAMGGLSAHVLVNAYEKDRPGAVPVQRWVDEQKLLYLDQKRSPEISERSGLQLPRDVRQLRGYKAKVLTEADLVNYRQTNGGGNTLFSRSSPSVVGDTYKLPPVRSFITKIFDRFDRIKQVQKAVKEQGGTVTDLSDIYGQEEAYHSRAASAIDRFRRHRMGALFKRMARAGVSLEDVGLYLYAQHAPERNAQIAKLYAKGGQLNLDGMGDVKMQDGGSGMTNAEARTIMAEFADRGIANKLDTFARELRDITADTRQILRASGLESNDAIDAWEQAYQFYVPLSGKDEANNANTVIVGRGFDVRGGQKRAMGRKDKAKHIIEQIIIQHEQAVIRAEKNAVAKRLLQFVKSNPDGKLWEVNPVQQRRYIAADGTVEYRDQPQRTDRNVVAVRINGKDTFILLADQGMADAIHNVGTEDVGFVLRALGAVSRFTSKMFTAFSPAFIAVNALRDFQTAMLHGYQVGGIDYSRQIAKNMPKAIAELVRDVRTGDSQLVKLYEQSGGRTGMVYMIKDFEEKHNEVMRQMAALQGVSLKEIQQAFAVGAKEGFKAVGRKARYNRFTGVFSAFVEAVETINGVVENATRLAAFKAAMDSGRSAKEAGSIAKNLTVNFNRKGELAPHLGSLYIFFNASVQGTVRMSEALKDRRLQVVAAGLFMASFLLAALQMDDDEDEDGRADLEQVPAWQRSRSLIIMGGEGDYAKIPLPLGWNVFHMLGTEAAIMLKSKSREAYGAGAMNMITQTVSAFNPVGDLTPSVAAPFLQIARNETAFGGPIYPDYKDQLPDSQQFYDGTEGSVYQRATALANEATGGNEFRPGLIDVNPEKLEHVVEFFGGGALRFLTDTVDAVSAATDGGPSQPADKQPIVRAFYGKLRDEYQTSRYYENKQKVESAALELKGLQESNRMEEADVRRSERPWVDGLSSLSDNMDRQLRQLKAREREIRADDSLTDGERRAQLQEIRELRGQLVKPFNAAYEGAMAK